MPASLGQQPMSQQIVPTLPAVESEQKDPSMRVEITTTGAWLLGVGSMIGAWVWLCHPAMLARAGPVACVTAWIVAAIATVPQALILMELSSMFPNAGGPFVYKYYALKRLIPVGGEFIGFLTGWLFWITLIVGLSCMSNGLVNNLAAVFWGSAALAPIWFGPAMILLLFWLTTVLNLNRIGYAVKLNNGFTLLKFGMAIAFGILVISSRQASINWLWQYSSPGGAGKLLSDTSSVLMLSMVGFGYIELSGCTSAETIDARRTVPKALVLTLLTTAAIYAAMCIAVSSSGHFVLSPDRVAMLLPGTSIRADCPSIAGYLGGPIWGGLFTAGLTFSILGCAFTAVLGLARISYSMACTGLFPAQFARLDDKHAVPQYALWFQFCCLCLIGVSANLMARTGVFADAYFLLAETTGFMYAFIAMLYGICVVSLRYTDPQMPRAFRIGRGNLLVSVLAVVTIGTWGYSAFGCTSPMSQLTGVLILLAGIPIYRYYRTSKGMRAASYN